MPRFRIRLNDPASEEFRVVVTHAATEAEALALALRNERKAVAHRLEPQTLIDDLEGYIEPEQVAALEAAQAEGTEATQEAISALDATVRRVLEDLPRGRKRGRLHMHLQGQAYEVVDVKGGD